MTKDHVDCLPVEERVREKRKDLDHEVQNG